MSIAPSADNYTLGRGRLLFNRKDSEGAFLGMRDLGNCPNFSMAVSVDKLEHYSNRSGLKVKDKSVITGMNVSSKFTLDEINAENIAMSLMASIETIIQTAEAGVTKTITASKKGQYFELGKLFVDTTGTITCTSDAGGTTHVNGTDYTIEPKSGKIFIMANSGIADDTELEVTFDTLDKSYYKLSAFDESAVEGELHFISDAAVGNNQQVKIWSVSLMPSGEMGFISEEWNSMEFECEIQKDEENHPLFPYMETIVE
jgi:hypothetical protein